MGIHNPASSTAIMVAGGVTVVIGVLTVATATYAIAMVRKVGASVGVAAPTASMQKEEDASNRCALFRHFPGLSEKLAWRSLGAASETPIHKCTLPSRKKDQAKYSNSAKNLEFLVKREDLISSEYGGNKVRTLQHLLAVCEARREAGQKAFRHLVSLGSGGSNQVLACVVYAQKLGWDNVGESTILPCWLESDEPDLDNTLNMLSVLSFPLRSTYDWGTQVKLWTKIKAIRAAWTQSDAIPMMVGGNCPTGVIGQASGMIELAEQIQAGASPDVERVYLPIGSGCTASGLVLGAVLARHLGLKAFLHPDFKIVACNVHPGVAALDHWVGLHKNPAFKFMPLTVTHSVGAACRALKDVGGPDVYDEAMQFIQTSLETRDDADVVGKYGCHSEKSREVARWYDQHGQVTNYKTAEKEKQLWVCGHFVAKALAPLLEDLEAASTAGKDNHSIAPKYMLWMTKSAVQPRGPENEWEKFQAFSDAVKEWADEGKAESILRPGRVSTVDGKPEDYRSIMTPISSSVLVRDHTTAQ